MRNEWNIIQPHLFENSEELANLVLEPKMVAGKARHDDFTFLTGKITKLGPVICRDATKGR